jgi:hypothetical protein
VRASNGLVRLACTTVLGALLGLTLAVADPFGRFGYRSSIEVPGLRLDRAGFRAIHPAADTFRFGRATGAWRAIETSDLGQTVETGIPAPGPDRVAANLLAPGLSLHFTGGLDLQLTSTAAPYLSWSEGSAGPDVPTPSCPWILISFRDAQPPVLFVFEGAPQSLVLTGTPGDWTLKSGSPTSGWVRVLLPHGTAAVPTASAASLGRAVARVREHEGVWLASAPSLLERTVSVEPTAVTVRWRFDRPGALVPAPVLLSQIGGYPLALLTPIRRLGFATEAGPMAVTEGEDLAVRLPVRRIPTGRGMTLGDPADWKRSEERTIGNLAELAMANLLGARSGLDRIAGEEAVGGFLLKVSYEQEPWTGVRLPYEASGAQLDVLAVHALLMQALASSTQSDSESNSILTSLSFRRDWHTWRFWGDDPVVARRAAALAALAGALCPEGERRAEAALLQAGLAAERAVQILRRRAGEIDAEPPFIEPMLDLRKTLFFLEPRGGPLHPFVRGLLSELRIFGDGAARLERREEGLVLVWRAGSEAGTITLASGYPVHVSGLSNLEGLVVTSGLGFTQIRYRATAAGVCTALVEIPEWAMPLPAAAPVPGYRE